MSSPRSAPDVTHLRRKEPTAPSPAGAHNPRANRTALTRPLHNLQEARKTTTGSPLPYVETFAQPPPAPREAFLLPLPQSAGEGWDGVSHMRTSYAKASLCGRGLDSVLSEAEGACPDAVLSLSKQSLEGVS